MDLEAQVRWVQAAWQEPLPRLLVFVTCEKEELLAKWRPSSGGCWVLLTSRRGRWGRLLGVEPLPVDVLSRRQRLRLLLKHRPDLAEEDPDLAAIAEELGDLPLALSLAGSYLESYQDDSLFGSPADFLSELRDVQLLDHAALQGEDVAPSPTNHSLHAGRTLSYERLNLAEPLRNQTGDVSKRIKIETFKSADP